MPPLDGYVKVTYNEKMDSSDSAYKITGFQSPCAEYHEDILSLDERYLVARPGIFIIEAATTSVKLGVRAGDKLIINRSLVPKRDDLVLVVINNNFTLTRFYPEQLKDKDPESEDFLWGVVTTLLREFR